MLLAAMLSLGFAVSAQAEPVLVSGCKLKATISGFDAAVIVGITAMEGEGTVICHNPLSGKTTSQKVGVLIAGAGIGPQVALPTFAPATLRIYALSAGITSPNAMYGEYHLGDNLQLRFFNQQASVGRDVAVTVHNGLGVSVNVNFQLLSDASIGLGYNYNIKGMTIMSKADYRAYKAQQKELYGDWRER